MSSMSISTLTTFSPSLKPHSHLLPFKFSSRIPIISSLSSSNIQKPLILDHRHTFSGLDAKKLGFSFGTHSGFASKAKNEEVEKESSVDEDEESIRGQSTIPERFRPFLKDLPEPPVRWPYLLALPFIFYAWRTVLWELSNWTKAASVIPRFFLDLLKSILAIILILIGNPITSLIRAIETALYTIRAFYSAIIRYTPISELTVIIMLTSATLAVAEATEPGSVNRQQNLLTVAGLAGFAAVRNFISELFFYTILLGLLGFARFVKKRDYVSSFLPVVTVLAAVGEPWFRVLVMSAYLGLAIVHHSKKDKEEGGDVNTEIRVPVPLVCAALAVGLRLAANWVGYRHLTWMIV